MVFVIEGACAPDPVQVLMIKRIRGIDYLDISVVCPFGTFTVVHIPRVGIVFHAAKSTSKFTREIAFHKGEITAHVENFVEDLDVDGTSFITSSATGAGPNFFGANAFE